MWLLLGLAGAAGYYLWTQTGDRVAPAQSPGVRVLDGAQYFNPDARIAVLSALPLLALEQAAEVDGAKTYRIVPSGPGPNAGAEVTRAITAGHIVGASVSLLDTNPEEHFVTIAFPNPGMRERVAAPGSPLALLFDPSHPEA